ncbi:hypothetical protein [Nonomuraea jiangxiensis]|uniref:Uncharacterized protein n=1 Tax=Nonomuraea jiangxiensis TaxID=633440 RepID=A0A1G8MFC9_9ACTN|nr:hypothetical protein [Nonomuraea jiangxiensis]SDI66718.1 hypothetical protein SAMN05421869_106398 [Nonomuraea jiangxiensis]
MRFKVGDLVEVRSEAEILATLDERGELDGLPFMPEMAAYCGRRLTVHKVAHKLCDTQTATGLRKMERAVHLTGARCDGSGHGGCQTACSMYWKEAWIRRVEPGSAPATTAPPDAALRSLLQISTRRPPEAGEERFVCQATELLRAAPVCLPVRSLGQYVTDVRTGNAGPIRTLTSLFIGLFNRVQDSSKRFLPKRLRFLGGRRWGLLKPGLRGRTPTGSLGLRPGELVRVKSKQEILGTLNEHMLNRGLGFEEEMARYCGKVVRVRSRVERCIDERTGRMLTMKQPCITLENVICQGVYSLNCPREFVPFWREIWLERVST